MAYGKRGDIKLNGYWYLLDKNQGDTAPVPYRRIKPPKATAVYQFENIQLSNENASEAVAILDNNPPEGFGNGRQVPGVSGSYAYSRNVSMRQRGVAFLSEEQTFFTVSSLTAGDKPRGFFQLPLNTSEVYILWGRYILAWNISTHAFRTAKDLGAGNTATQVGILDGTAIITNHVVSSGAANPIVYVSHDGSTETWATGPDGVPPSGSNLDAIAISSDTYGACAHFSYRTATSVARVGKLSSGADLSLATSYGTGTPFGDTGDPIKWLVRYGYQVFGAQPGGFFGYDQNLATPNQLAAIAHYRNAENGKQTIEWNGALIIPHLFGVFGFNGNVGDITPTNDTTIGPDEDGRRLGVCVAQTTSGKNIYQAWWNSTDTYVLIGRENSGQGKAVIWDTEYYIPGKGPFTAMDISGLSDPPVLLLIQQSATSALCMIPLARADNQLQDTQNKCDSGDVYYPALTFGFPGIDKTLEEVKVIGYDFTSSEKATIYFRMGNSGSWQSLGSCTSNVTTLRPTDGQTVTGEKVQVYAHLERGATKANTPKLENIQVRCQLDLDQGEIWELPILLGSEQIDNEGRSRNSLKTLKDNLKNCEKSKVPVEYIDPDGVSHDAVIISYMEVNEANRQEEEDPQQKVVIKVRVLGED